MFRCPLVENRMVIVSRRCSDGGVWESFSEADCGVVNEQLNRLNGTFNNVSQNLSNEMTPPSFPKQNSQKFPLDENLPSPANINCIPDKGLWLYIWYCYVQFTYS